jgi:hypothetical protein
MCFLKPSFSFPGLVPDDEFTTLVKLLSSKNPNLDIAAMVAR